MPVRQFVIDLSTVAQTVIVPAGNRLNAVSVLALSVGGELPLKLGNNPTFTLTEQGRLRVGSGALAQDAQQGLIVDNTVAQAGITARILVSYQRPGDGQGMSATVERAADRSIDYGS